MLHPISGVAPRLLLLSALAGAAGSAALAAASPEAATLSTRARIRTPRHRGALLPLDITVLHSSGARRSLGTRRWRAAPGQRREPVPPCSASTPHERLR